MRRNILCLLFACGLSALACSTELTASNPYDPDTPVDQQTQAVLSGLVVSRSDGGQGTAVEPIMGARVGFLEGAQTLTTEWQITDADGRFSYGQVRPGT